MAYEPELYSSQLSGIWPPERGVHAPLKTIDNGHILCMHFNYTFTGNESTDDVIGLAVMPVGIKFLKGDLMWSSAITNLDQAVVGAFGANGDGTINSAGTADDDNVILTTTDMSAGAGQAVLSSTSALWYGVETSKEIIIGLTLGSSGTISTNSVDELRGSICYLKN